MIRVNPQYEKVAHVNDGDFFASEKSVVMGALWLISTLNPSGLTRLRCYGWTRNKRRWRTWTTPASSLRTSQSVVMGTLLVLSDRHNCTQAPPPPGQPIERFDTTKYATTKIQFVHINELLRFGEVGRHGFRVNPNGQGTHDDRLLRIEEARLCAQIEF